MLLKIITFLQTETGMCVLAASVAEVCYLVDVTLNSSKSRWWQRLQFVVRRISAHL